jgi:hypothetical protein
VYWCAASPRVGQLFSCWLSGTIGGEKRFRRKTYSEDPQISLIADINLWWVLLVEERMDGFTIVGFSSLYASGGFTRLRTVS